MFYFNQKQGVSNLLNPIVEKMSELALVYIVPKFPFSAEPLLHQMLRVWIVPS